MTNDAMNTPWPQWLIDSFVSANQRKFQLTGDQNEYYGPYTRLLYYLFGVDSPFEINPRYHIPRTPCDMVDVVALFTVEFNKHPVFFIQVKPPAYYSRIVHMRKQADEQLRDHFSDLRHNLVTPRLPGISAFGTRMAFYEYVTATNTLTPHAIFQPTYDPISIEKATADRWSYDVLEANGTAQMRKVVEDVKAMCQALNN